MKRYQFLEHQADLKVRVFGKDYRQLFTNAVLAMFESIITGKIRDLKPAGQEELELKSDSVGGLLIDLLNELIYLSDTKKQLYSLKKIEIKKNALKAILLRYPLEKGQLKTEIKAATSHNFKITESRDIKEAEIVFDV